MLRHLNYDFLDCAKNMPPLQRKKTDEDFDVRKSEVCKWLVKQTEVMQKVLNMATRKGVIEFDSESGKWYGIDYDQD